MARPSGQAARAGQTTTPRVIPDPSSAPVPDGSTVLPVTILVQGGIASGKSTVGRMVAERAGEDGRFVDCDRIAHDALREPAVLAAVRESFGPAVFGPAGEVERRALAEVVFHDPAALARLEEIVHPRVIARVQELLQHESTPPGRPRRVVVLDAAVGDRMRVADYDLVLFVDAPLAARRVRAQQRSKWSEGELERREARQAPLEAKKRMAHYVVVNDGELEETVSHVERFWTELVQPRR